MGACMYRYCISYTVALDQRRKNDQGLPHGTMASEQHDGIPAGVFEHECTWTKLIGRVLVLGLGQTGVYNL